MCSGANISFIQEPQRAPCFRTTGGSLNSAQCPGFDGVRSPSPRENSPERGCGVIPIYSLYMFHLYLGFNQSLTSIINWVHFDNCQAPASSRRSLQHSHECQIWQNLQQKYLRRNGQYLQYCLASHHRQFPSVCPDR